MSWQRPNIGSRVTREGHARFWERPEVKFLRATQHPRPRPAKPHAHARPLRPESDRSVIIMRSVATCHYRTSAVLSSIVSSARNNDEPGIVKPSGTQQAGIAHG